MRRSFLGVVGAAALALLAACGGGGGGGTDSASSSTGGDGSGGGSGTGGGTGGGTIPSGDTSAPLTDSVSDVPVAGQFLAECIDTGVAVIDSFVSSGLVGTVVPGGQPSLSDVIADFDLSSLPVIGGLIPDIADPSVLLPVSVADITSLVAGGVVPGTLPVLGQAPVNCSSLPIPGGELPDPTDALGLIPVVGPSGDVIGLILATVSNLPSGGGVPEVPSVPDVTTIGLPIGTETLPEPIGSAVGSLLGLLGL